MNGPPAAAAQPGQGLGPWRLLRRLGLGGMGEVWLAERADGLYEAQAAIKLLRSDLTGPGLAARFARERALLARLQHPGIARLLDAGLADGQAYLVIEYVPGVTLSEHVAAQGLNLRDRVRLLLDVAGAVEHAHAQLIVHRDLKPANVMVTPQGQTKLLDFGVATLLNEDEGQTPESALTRLSGRRLTPAYAAPEQILGEPVGTATDVFSLGVMLFELATGSLPFGAPGTDRRALEHAILHQEAPRLTRAPASHETGPGQAFDYRQARGDLEAVAAKALRKKPQERYASVRSLIDDLQAWLDHRPVSVRQEDWRHRTRLWLRRHAGLAAGGAVVLLSLGLGLGASLWQWQRAETEARRSARAMDYLTELLSSANPAANAGRPPTVPELLDRSQLELDDRFAQDPVLQLTLLGVLSHVNHALGRGDRSIEQGERQLQLAVRHWGALAPETQAVRLRLAQAYVAAGVNERVLALMQDLHRSPALLAAMDAPAAYRLLSVEFVAQVRTGQLDQAEARLPGLRAAEARAVATGKTRPGAVANKEALLRYTQGRFREAEAALVKVLPLWRDPRVDPVEAYAQRRVLLTARMRQLQRLDFEAEVRRFEADAAPVFGADSDLVLGLRHELASWLIDQGRFEEAARERQALLQQGRAQGTVLPLIQLPRRLHALWADTLAGRQPREALLAQARELAQALAAEPSLAGQQRADAWIQLLRLGLQLDGALADEALAQLQGDAGLRVAQTPPLRERVMHLEGQRARQLGQLERSHALLQARIAALDAVDEVNQMPRWRAQLDLACTLLHLGRPDEARASLLRADQLRPQTLAPGHLLDRWREALGRGRRESRLDGLS